MKSLPSAMSGKSCRSIRMKLPDAMRTVPDGKLPIHTIALMRVAGKTYGEIGKELGVPPTTIKNYRREICREVDEIKKVVKIE